MNYLTMINKKQTFYDFKNKFLYLQTFIPGKSPIIESAIKKAKKILFDDELSESDQLVEFFTVVVQTLEKLVYKYPHVKTFSDYFEYICDAVKSVKNRKADLDDDAGEFGFGGDWWKNEQ